jgi:hypothetical protein
MDHRELNLERSGDDLREPGPLSVSGEWIYSELERAVEAGDAPLAADDLRLLASAAQTLAAFGQLLVAAAAGDLATLDILRDRLKREPGENLWRDLEMFTARLPTGPIFETPCHIGPANLPAMVWAGLHLSADIGDRTWVDRAFSEYAALGGGIDRVLSGGQEWLSSGNPGPLAEGLDVLRGVGLPGQRSYSFPCLDEQQVCLDEFVFFAFHSISAPRSFPKIASVTPADACLGYTGLVTLLPAAGSFPSPGALPGVFPTIDRFPADIVSWTGANIQLRLPAGTRAGCHTVGWMYMMDPDTVSQLHAIGEQCMPWFPANSLRIFPYSLWRDDAHFSLVGEPAIAFDANGATTLEAEACTSVPLRWAVTLHTCPQTVAALAVSLLRNGQPFRPTLAPSGQLPVSDADNATYILQASSRLGAQACVTAQRSVTINRDKRIRIRPPIDRCLDTQAIMPLDITVSCPAPAGGLAVTVASNEPTRIANTSGTILEGATTASIDVTAGSECGPVTLTVSAPGHTPAQASLVVVAVPQIATMTPAVLPTCADLAFTLSGSCLGDQSHPPQVLLTGPGGAQTATVTVRIPQQEIGASRPFLPAGLYTVAVSNCGRMGYAPVPMRVENRAPVITTPLKADAPVVLLCTSPTLRLSWEVQYVSSIQLTRDRALMAQRTYDPCQRASDSVSDQVPTVTAGVSYVLTATNPDGAITTSTLTIPAAPPAPPASSFAPLNSFVRRVNVFLLNREDFGGVFVGTLPPGQGSLVSIPNCRIRAIASLDPAEVEAHNRAFPQNQFDPTAVNTVRTAGRWSRTNSAFALGQAASGTVSVSV